MRVVANSSVFVRVVANSGLCSSGLWLAPLYVRES